MERQRLSLDSFIRQIEETFGKKLTVQASEAAEDFWNYWEAITELISNRQLSVRVDTLFLVHNFPQYRRYHTWKGRGIMLILAGLGVVWFWWPMGIILLLIGFGLRSYGNRVRFNDAKNFADEVMKEATLSPSNTGYARLCAYYIAGIIELATPQASAHWHQHPSNVVTGEQTFIDT